MQNHDGVHMEPAGLITDLKTVSNNYLLTRKDMRGWSLLYQGDETTKPQAGTNSGRLRRLISRTMLKWLRWWFVTRKTTSTKLVTNKRMNLHVFLTHGTTFNKQDPISSLTLNLEPASRPHCWVHKHNTSQSVDKHRMRAAIRINTY